MSIMLWLLCAAAAAQPAGETPPAGTPPTDTSDQMDHDHGIKELRVALALLEAAHPEIAAEVEQEECAAAVGEVGEYDPEALTLAVELEHDLVPCVRAAKLADVPVDDLRAVIEHVRKLTPDGMAKQNDQVWSRLFSAAKVHMVEQEADAAVVSDVVVVDQSTPTKAAPEAAPPQ